MTTSMRNKVWNKLLIQQANFRVFINLTLPIRLYYARDQSQYFVASDEEACNHYGETQSKFRRIHCYVAGFAKGLTWQVPEWFIERWFNEANLPAA